MHDSKMSQGFWELTEAGGGQDLDVWGGKWNLYSEQHDREQDVTK